MKAPILLSLLLAVPAVRAAEMRDVATHEQLSERLAATTANDPMKSLAVAEGEDPAKAAQPEDLVGSSDILCFNGTATLVPRGALLVVPESFRSRIGFTAGARIVPWSEFFSLNHGWIETMEITIEQATAREPLPATSGERLKKATRVVVATLKGGPITLAVPAEKDAAAGQQPAAR